MSSMVSGLSEDSAGFPIIGSDLSEYSPNLPFVHEKYPVVRKSGRVLEIASNIHLKFLGLNVRRTGCPRSFSVEHSAKLPPNIQNSGQVCMFQGKNDAGFRAITTSLVT